MHPVAILLAISALQPPTVFEGGKLESVPGPIAPQDPDFALGPGSTSTERAMRTQARRGASLQAVAVPVLPCIIEDRVEFASGWKAYRVEAPAGATVKARLRGEHEGWFVVKAVNRWGTLEKGMLQNRIPTGNPEASYINPKREAATFFFVVDTTVTSADREPYRLELTLK